MANACPRLPVFLMLVIWVILGQAFGEEVRIQEFDTAHYPDIDIRLQATGDFEMASGNLAVRENDLPMEVLEVSAGEKFARARSFIFLTDTSSSMRGDPIRVVQKHLQTFADKLRPEDQAAIMTFSDRIYLLQGLTDDKTEIKRAISEVSIRQGTSRIYDAIQKALEHFSAATGRGNKMRENILGALLGASFFFNL
ncbi:MAG: VWA domain-containing protein, partial [Planctomycetes bacterium]|nr:VWA domain-containing protein [Planctomycetota bacterium]